ncbi:hypothetical protein HPB52_020068 [Rhipicephalus sanguineus]|uniref:GH18 domain-containing protein n=1 Tax=Rhipicephalus sanguineus TaxID=34632 RepID=A0A9D4T1T5_RHISA|nr:hypothetical protein HPB52_020068 [Rhipicephalus sanguineus]
MYRLYLIALVAIVAFAICYPSRRQGLVNDLYRYSVPPDFDADILEEEPSHGCRGVASADSLGFKSSEHVSVAEAKRQKAPPEPAVQTQGGTGSRRGDDPTASDDRFCLRLWLVWAGLTCPLVLCLWLFLVPFLVNNTTTLPPMPTIRGLTSGGAGLPTVPINLPPNVPSTCLEPASLPVLSGQANTIPDPTSGPSKEPVRPFFCLFNNTAVFASRNYSGLHVSVDFTFRAVPFELCHYVIYWSVAINNGEIISRLPWFDQHHGLYQLRNITENLGYQNVKILLALGGYLQDGPHFSVLGHDSVTLNRLTSNVVDAMSSFRLDGVAVHWVDSGPTCRGPDDQGIVAALLRMLRQAFDNAGLTQALVTAMMDGRDSVERLISTSKDVVDYFFLTDSRLYPNGSRTFYDICYIFSKDVDRTVNHYISSVPGLRWNQICTAEPVAFFTYDGDIDLTTKDFVPQPGRRFRRAPIYESCNRLRFCRVVTSSHTCIVHFATYGYRPNSTTLLAATAYLTELTHTLDTRFRNRSQSSATGEPCTFATLIEYDNYAGQCPSRYNRNILLRHLYFGSLGQLLGKGSIEVAAPSKHSPTC